MKKTSRKPIPKFKNEDEEHEFWATHSPLDFFDLTRAQKVAFPNLKPSVKTISIRLPEMMIEELKLLANKRDVPYQSLLKMFLAERINAELQHSGRRYHAFRQYEIIVRLAASKWEYDSMVRSSDFQKANQLIDKAQSVLVTTHTKPDGDACGCVAAMCEAIAALGKSVTPLMLSPVPEWYAFLFAGLARLTSGGKVPVLGENIKLEELTAGRFDLVVIVDTNSTSQLPGFDEYLKQNSAPVLIIDHHETSDGLGDVELIDRSAAAAGLIVLDLFKHAGWTISESIAQAMFIAIATDTGWFQFSNTNSRTLRACAELIDAGAKPTQLHADMYQNFSHARFRLMVAMLNSLELHLDSRYAVMQVTQQDFARTGAAYSDTENLINESHRIGTVRASALFIELKDGRIRCSLRSRGGPDVSQIAIKFGGGGHTMAAGTFLPGPLEHAEQLILAEMQNRL